MWARSCAFSRSNSAAAADDVAAVVDVRLEDLLDADGARLAIDQRQHVDGEGGLHGGVLVERVQQLPRVRLALQLDDDAHAVAVGLVAQVGDALDALGADEVGDLLDERGLVRLVRQLGDDDLVAVGLGASPRCARVARMTMRPRPSA